MDFLWKIYQRNKNTKTLYIDIQGFDVPTFTPKELALTYDGKIVNTYLFKPVTSFALLDNKVKQTVRWVEKYHHGIPYNSGDYNLSDIENIINEYPADLVIVKGSQKLLFLQNYYKHVKNIENMTSTNFEKQIVNDCLNHHHHVNRCMCSKRNVMQLFEFYTK